MLPFSWGRWLRRCLKPSRVATIRRKSSAIGLEPLEARLAPATRVWTGGGGMDMNWSNAANWGGVAIQAGDDLVFGAGATQRSTVNDIADFNARSITISADGYTIDGERVLLGDASLAGNGSITVNSGSSQISANVRLNAPTGGNQHFFSINTGAQLTISGRLSSPTEGSTGTELTKSGFGTLVLSGDNSVFRGTITVQANGGNLRVEHANALGDTFGTTTVNVGAQLQINNVVGGAIGESILVSGAGSANTGVIRNLAGNNQWGGSVTLVSNSFLGADAGSSLEFTGTISDLTGQSLTKVGAGTIILSAANTYSGQTIVNHGVLAVRHANALGTTDGTAATGTIVNQSIPAGTAGTLLIDGDPLGNNSSLTIANELLTLNGRGFGTSIGSTGNQGALFNNTGDNTWTGNIILGSLAPDGSDVNIGVNAEDGVETSLTVTGVVMDPNGTFNLRKVGEGNLIFVRENTYNGSTVIADGTLTIRDSRGLGTTTGATTVNDGATLRLEVDGNVDSVTANTFGLYVTETLTINGLGIGSNGALFSASGINVYAGNITMTNTNINVGNAIGVNADPTPSSTAAYFPTYNGMGHATGGDESLTVIGSIGGGTSNKLRKVGDGHLILPNANNYTGLTEFVSGWVTIRNNNSLGAEVAGRGDAFPDGPGSSANDSGTTVRSGAALHLKPATPGGSLNLGENLTLFGTGISHPFADIDQKGALLSLEGINTVSGEIDLGGNVGIGVQNIDAANFPMGGDLILTGSIGQVQPTVDLNVSFSGGPIEQSDIFNVGAAGGTLFIQYTFFNIRGDRAAFYYGPRGTPDSVLLYDTQTATANVQPLNQTNDGLNYTLGSGFITIVFDETSATFTHEVYNNSSFSTLLETVTGTITYPAVDSSQIEIVINEGGNGVIVGTGQTAWNYSGNFTPNQVQGGIIKLGTQRLTIQGDGTYTGDVEVREGVVRAQHNTALGAPGGGDVILQDGTALELTTGIAENNGGIAAGIQVWDKNLVINSTGNTLYNLAPVVNLAGDNMWRGTVEMNNNVTFDVRDDSRLTLYRTVSDAGNMLAAGSDLTKIGGGALALYGENTYRGVTFIDEGILTIGNSLALGTADGTAATGTVVADGATLELVGSLVVAGEALIVEGSGVGATPNIPLNWFNVGPSPMANGQTADNGDVSGRVTGIVIDPSDSNTIYVSTNGGGAWKTENGGQTWQPLFDGVSGAFSGSIAISPTNPNVIYLATGEGNNSSDSFYGTGVYRSTDGGRTWTDISPAGNEFFRKSITKIVVDPSNSNIVYVTVSDGANGINGGSNGLWRYNGTMWTNLSAAAGSPSDDANTTFTLTDHYTDVAVFVDPTNASNRFIVFAIGTANGSFNNGVFISLDNGATFVRASFPAVENVNSTDFPVNGVIKVGAARTGSGVNAVITIYAPVTYPPNGANGTTEANQLREIRSTTITNDGSGWTVNTWGTVTSPGNYMGTFPLAQGDYDTTVAVQSNNPNNVAVAGLNQIFLSTDGGSSWTNISVGGDGVAPHFNYHAMNFDAQGRLVVGTDGGVWRYTPSEGNWTNLNGDFFATTSFNGVATHPTDPNVVYGGMQFNGLGQFTGDMTWVMLDGSQVQSGTEGPTGGRVFIDPNNPQILYAIQTTSVPNPGSGGSNTSLLRRSTDGGQTWTTIRTVSFTNNAPFVLDSVNTSRLVLGGNFPNTALQESLDGGNTWTTLSGNLPVGYSVTAIGLATFQGDFDATGFGALADKGENGYDPDTLYVTNGTTVFLTKNHGVTWVNRTSNLPSGSIVDLVVDPTNRDTVYVIRNTFDGQQVWRSTNAGQSWTNITADLPNFPAWTLEIDPRNGDLYLGTDRGVYVMREGNVSNGWDVVGAGMPLTQVRALELNQTTNILTAGTYGRGMFQLYLTDTVVDGGAIRAVSGSSVWAGTVTMIGDTTVGANGNQNIQNGRSIAQLRFQGTIDGDFDLTKVGQGDVILAAANTYTGDTFVNEGVLVVQNPNALGTTDGETFVDSDTNPGTALELQSSLNGETLNLRGDGVAFDGRNTGVLRSVSNINTFTGTINLLGDITIGVDAGSDLTITGNGIDGSFGVTKELDGRLTFATANTYTGITDVRQGILRIQDADSLGTGDGTPATGTIVQNNAQLQLDGSFDVEDEHLTLAGAGILGTGALRTLGGTNTWTGPVLLASPPTTVVIGVDNGGETTISGAIGDGMATVALDKVGAGRLILSGANTYDGLTTVMAGALQARNNTALGSAMAGTVVNNGAALELGGDITVSGEALTINGAGISNTGALRNVDGSNTWTGTVTLANTPATNDAIGADAMSQVLISGVIQDPMSGTPASLRKVGEGTVAFSGNNTYGGATTVENGILNIRHANALGGTTNGTTVNSGATLQLQNNITVTGEALTINGLGFNNQGALDNASGTNTWNNTVQLGSNASVGSQAGSLILNQPITDSGNNRSVTKQGPGTVQYAGSTPNAYTGATIVNDGTLQLNKTGGGAILGDLTIGDTLGLTDSAIVQLLQANQIANSSNVTIERDGLFNLNNFAEEFNNLFMTGGEVRTGGASGSLAISSVTATSVTDESAEITGAGSLALGSVTRTFTINDGPQATDLRVDAIVTGPGGGAILKFGDGRLELNAVNTYTGTTTINEGDVQVDGTIGNVMLAGGTVSGGVGVTTGTVGMISGSPGGINPGSNGPTPVTGILTTSGNVTLNASNTFSVNLNNTIPGTGHDQLVVNGNITLNGASIGGMVGGPIMIGDTFVIITYTGMRTGEFTHIGDNNEVLIDGLAFEVIYDDADKQIVLERLASATTTTVTSSVNPSVYGQEVIFTANVAATLGGGIPPDNLYTVTFVLDSFPGVTVPVVNGQAVFDPQLEIGGPLTLGMHTVMATFNGDATFLVSNGSLSPVQQVNPAATTTVITVNPANPVTGQSFQIVATVAPVVAGIDTPTGTVNFVTNIPGVGNMNVALNGSGQAIINVPAGLNPLTYTISATYVGDGNFLGSTSGAPFMLVVNKDNVNVVVDASPTTVTYGSPVTISVAVTPNLGTGTPGGVVRFYNGAINPANLIGTQTLVSGVANLMVSNLNVGMHTINVEYLGNSNYNGGVGSSAVITVNQAATGMNLTTSQASAKTNLPITFTATLTGGSPGNRPTGMVEFYNGATIPANLLGTGTINSNGVATFTTAALEVGMYTINAVYNGDGNFGSATDSVSQTINQRATTVQLAAVPSSVIVGETTTLTATVVPGRAGPLVPGGTVTFFAGATTLGTSNVMNGVATLDFAFNKAGAKNITAVYSGDDNFTGNNVTVNELVRVANFSTSISVTKSPGGSTVYGNNVTITATVSSTMGVPPGEVVFRLGSINGQLLGRATVNANGQATIVVNNIPVGTQAIVATFRPTDTTMFASSRNDTSPLLHTVTKANTSTTVVSSVNPSLIGQAVTFTATVNGSTGQPNNPTGTVTFFVNGQNRGTVALNASRQASITISNLPAGNNNVQVVYNGNGNYNGSTSGVLTQNVRTTPPATRITASVVAPNGVQTGTSFTVQSKARDQFNNQVSDYNEVGSIAILSGPAGAQLTGNVVASYVNGYVQFTNLQVNLAGTYILQVSSGGFTTTVMFTASAGRRT